MIRAFLSQAGRVRSFIDAWQLAQRRKSAAPTQNEEDA
jgi:hypothetical protein